jgi:histone-lysine N-methyltransferase SETD1
MPPATASYAKDANASDTITPVNTPPETRRSIFPPDGARAERLSYDPWTDAKLDKRARNSRKANYKTTLDKVREGYTRYAEVGGRGCEG